MEFLGQERQTLERYMPGLDCALAKMPLLEMEKRGNPGLIMFREANGPALLVTPACRGMGATALDAIRIQRAIASRSPSLAVATTMHHFSVATFPACKSKASLWTRSPDANRPLIPQQRLDRKCQTNCCRVWHDSPTT